VRKSQRIRQVRCHGNGLKDGKRLCSSYLT